MGLFSKAENDFNRALDHYQNAKNVGSGSDYFIKELLSAAEILQNYVRKSRIVSDEYILLANIYFSLFLENETKVISGTLLNFAAANIYHWRTNRGYTKNKQNANKVYDFILSAFREIHPNLSESEIENRLFNSVYEDYFSLSKSANLRLEFETELLEKDVEERNPVRIRDPNSLSNIDTDYDEDKDFFDDYPSQ